MMIFTSRPIALGCTLFAILFSSSILRAQQEPASAEKPAGKAVAPVKIADEPKTVDPATLVPSKVATVATVRFEESTLADVVKWIRDNQKLVVLIDKRELSDKGLLFSEPVSDRLDGDPLYLLLDRMRTLGLAWYLDDGILHITTLEAAENRLATKPYNVGDLIDAGYKPEDLTETILNTIEPNGWNEVGGNGVVELLGDVLFVRQTDPIHREVAGLLTALRRHARHTFTLDAPQHESLRQKLEQKVSVNFDDTPLAVAIADLAQQTKADIRLDIAGLRDIRIRDREPVSLQLAETRLSTVLQVLLSDLQLTWVLRDGVLWITSQEETENFLKTAVYDVRDLCRDEAESEALQNAIQSQSPDSWCELGGPGMITFARPGVMVVLQTETELNDALRLLGSYRAALLASKPRKRDIEGPKDIVTRYYRMPEVVARGIRFALPQLVRSDTWMSDKHPKSQGTILQLASGADLLDAHGSEVVSEPDPGKSAVPQALIVPHSVLIIRQMREVHDEIVDLIAKVRQGDAPVELVGGGGGFGGGFFSVPQR